MPKVIKAGSVTVKNEYQKIEVPSKNFFNPKAQRHDGANALGGLPSENAEGFEQEGFEEDFIDPEQVIREATEKAEALISGAKEEADLIIQKAKLKSEEESIGIREAAKNEGYEEGWKQANKDAEALKQEAEELLNSAHEEKKEILKSSEPEVVSFMIDTIESLLGGLLKLNPTAMLHVVKKGLEGIAGANEVSIRVSKEDFETVTKLKDEISTFVDSDTSVSIIKDTLIEQGSCIIDTPIGSIDSSIDSQWRSLKNDLLLALKAAD